jgi:hypothetical protein
MMPAVVVHRFHYTIGERKGGMSVEAASVLALRIGRLGPAEPERLAERIDRHVTDMTTDEFEFSAADCELIARALLPPPRIKREDVVEKLARLSHETWMRQKSEDAGTPREQLPADVAKHDRERAKDTVRELERLCVL